MMPLSFRYNAKTYDYEQGAKWARAVEIPIFWDIITREVQREDKLPVILEVGNVMAHYRPEIYHWDDYDVLDLFEHDKRNPDIINQDATFWRPDAAKYSMIISISTLEHIGQARYWGTDQRFQPMAAALNLYTWALTPGGRFIFSIPLRFRAAADDLVWRTFPRARAHFLRKTGQHEWRQVQKKVARRIKHYGRPYPGANGLAIVEVEKRLDNNAVM